MTPDCATAYAPIEVWVNQNPQRNSLITIRIPEFTSVCPKTGLPDFGTITVDYIPDQVCVELKAFKYYLLSYRNVGMFYENIVNKLVDDVVAAAHPRWLKITGDFTPRGGISTQVVVQWQQPGFVYHLANTQ